jgi:soluble lytic murein transglycosylase-like protein
MIYPYQQVLNDWRALATLWATARGNLEPAEILAIITEESSGNPKAMNPGDPSWGLMGVSLFIGKEYAGVANGTQLYDPTQNIKAGSGFLSYLKARYANTYPLKDDPPAGWIQAYNLGEPAFLKGERVPGYEQAFLGHLAAFRKLISSTP